MTSTIKTASFALPKLNRTAPPGRPSQYRDQLAALEAGNANQCVVDDDLSIDPDKQEQRFSSAIAQYRKATGDRAKFTIRKFEDVHPETGATITRVGVWKLEGLIAEKKAKAPASTDTGAASEGTADAATGSTGDASFMDGAQG